MKVKLKDVRLSFPTLFQAEQYQGKGAFRYGATFLVVPGSENDKAIRAAIVAEAQAKFPKDYAKKITAWESNGNKCCYTPGDLKSYDGYKGVMALTGHRKQEDGRPLVIDANKAPLSAEDGKPYAGCYVNASVEIYCQDGQNEGIRCGLSGVQFARDGDAFSGAGRADVDDFEDVQEGAAASDLL